MKTSFITLLLIFYFSFHLFLVKSHVSPTLAPNGHVIGVPAFDISQKSLMQYLQLGDINIDLRALYVFGDSIVDSGNNNCLNTKPKANFLPYGVDFNGKPTGRFTNGRTIADFLAQVAGLPFPPAYLAMSETEKKTTRTGVNYASSSSGILPTTGIGEILSLDKQIDFFECTVKNLKCQFNSTESFANYLSKSLLLINTGKNDMGIAYDMVWRNNFTDCKFAQFLSQELSKRLQRLYKLGARNFLVNTAAPLGCTPFIREFTRTKILCADDVNMRISEYNKLLPNLLKQLQSELPESKFVLGESYKFYMDVLQAPASFGITNTRDACCVNCAANVIPCKDRNQHVFFDGGHPSEAMHFIITKRLLKDPSICTPISLLELMQA